MNYLNEIAANVCVSATHQTESVPQMLVRSNATGGLLDIDTDEPFLEEACFYAADGRLCLGSTQNRVDGSSLATRVYWVKGIGGFCCGGWGRYEGVGFLQKTGLGFDKLVGGPYVCRIYLVSGKIGIKTQGYESI